VTKYGFETALPTKLLPGVLFIFQLFYALEERELIDLNSRKGVSYCFIAANAGQLGAAHNSSENTKQQAFEQEEDHEDGSSCRGECRAF
jgi:hypothetical protein